MARSLWIALVGATLGVSGCTGTVMGNATDGEGTSGGGNNSNGTGGNETGGNNGNGDAVGSSPSACASTSDKPAMAPARRLNRTEYVNTVRDLFEGVTMPNLDLPADKTVEGFDNNVTTQGESPSLLESHVNASKAIVTAIKTPLAFMGCPATPTAACIDAFLGNFGLRALRRPLDAGEMNRYRDFFTTNAAKYDADSAARMLIQTLLLTPSFLYRVELGTPDAARPGIAELGGYELAARLSYLLWQSLPDKALFDAASTGELASVSEIETQAKRMLADPRAAATIANFQRQWLELDKLNQVNRSTALFKNWSNTTAQSLAESTAKFLDDDFWRGEGTVQSLLTSQRAFVNADLARIYGVPAPGGSGFSAIDLDPAQRKGFLTQAGVMAALAHDLIDAPILRGVFVLRRFLCAPPPAPPPGVMDTVGQNTGMPLTTRQHFEQTHTGPSCRGCHAQIDSIGFLFEHYDAIGQHRTQENGVGVDSRSTIADAGSELDGTYNDILDFVPKLAASEQTVLCAGRHAFRFAMGRNDTEADECTISRAMAAAEGRLRDYLVNLTLSDAFRYRVIDAQ